MISSPFTIKMSGHISKTPRARPNQRESLDSLASHIVKFGFEVMPCTPCFNRGLKCLMTEEIGRCAECVRSRRQCDGSGVPIDSLRRIGEEKDRLDREEQLAEESLLRLQKELKEDLVRKQRSIDEAVGRLIRLRHQKEFLRKRGVKMVQRGLQSLDELDELEAAEMAGGQVAETSGATEWPELDWDALMSGASVVAGGSSSEVVEHP